MTNDRFSRALLTVIALSLAVLALRNVVPVANAAASGGMKCEIVGTVNVAGKVTIDTFNTPIAVKASEEVPVRLRESVGLRIERIESTVPVKVERIDSTVQVKQN